MARDAGTGLADCMARIEQQLANAHAPSPDTQKHMRDALLHFLAQHASIFNFDNFPLPAGQQDALASYTLHQSARDGLNLRINATRGGTHSAVHDHGTWALIIGIRGTEINRLYRDTAHSLTAPQLTLEREAAVSEGQSLYIDAAQFHSIHTQDNAPALHMHLYGKNPDVTPDRRVVDPVTNACSFLTS